MSEMIAGRYVIVKKLGEGGMADVYLALDTVLNREVALKMLRGSLALEPVSLLRFQREANSTLALNHPNIVEIYDVGEDDGRHFIIMEYIRGKTLKQLISQRGALEKQEAVSIMDQLVGAVKEAHKHNIIHRDIKPQNVLVKDDGTVKIADFGIATVADAMQLTQADTVLGSVHYLAPELARGESATYQSDIYALGITFYELVTGQVPHHGDQPVQIAMKHLKDEIPSVRDFNPSLPQSLENIIIKSTAKNKNLRYHSADEFQEDLKSCLSEKYKNVQKLKLESLNEHDDTIMIQRVDKVDSDRPRKPFLKSVSGLGLMGLSFVFVVFLLQVTGIFSPFSRTVLVPELINLTVEEARDALFEVGLTVSTNVKYELTENTQAGLIVKSVPSTGSEIERGSTVVLTISEGIYTVVDNYVGQNIDAVEALLSNSKITLRIQYQSVTDVVTGTIVGQELLLPGTKLDPQRQYEMKLIVASPVEFLIPQIVGVNIVSAQAQLEALGAVVSLNQLSTDGMTESQKAKLVLGVVVSISPEPLTYYTQTSETYITLSYY